MDSTPEAVRAIPLMLTRRGLHIKPSLGSNTMTLGSSIKCQKTRSRSEGANANWVCSGFCSCSGARVVST